MDIEAIKKTTLPRIDAETIGWLKEFCTWKRKKIDNIESFRIDYILEYMDTHAVDYFFIRRNYSYLQTLISGYGQAYGQVEGITQLIKDLTEEKS